ncbi:unnamed protein product [Allacma fusca]|uniref:Ionotropic glutamate receptor C-terminal domain-containing protein n=1 Tax=Allacma fusca TaxID=39272 RepID=A0A8J2JTH5_9HEXA|nr:unnamed protein product [Allacma fusca]
MVSIPLFYIHLKLKRSNDREPADKMYSAVVITFLALIEASPSIPNRARIIAFITLFYAVLVGQFYSSNLMSFLTFPDPEVIPESFEELSNRDVYTIYTMHVAGSTLDMLFNETKRESLLRIKQHMTNQKDFFKCAESAVFSPITVCIDWPVIMDFTIARNFTLHSTFNPLLTVPPVSSSNSFSVALQKNSKHFESMNSIVGSTMDTGHFIKWKENPMDKLKHIGSKWLKETSSELYQKLKS